MNKKIQLPEDPEIIVAYSFINKYKNLLVGGVLLIALLIVGKIWYNDSTEKSRKLAAEKLFAVKVDFDNNNFEKVIKDGLENINKFSGYNQSGEIMLLVAKAYVGMNKPDEAVKILEKCASSFSGDDLLAYSANYMLAVITLDKAVAAKDKAGAEKAAGLFEKASKTNQNVFADQCSFYAAKAFIQADKKDKAKEILTALDKKEEVAYAIKDKAKKLLNTL